MSDRGTVAERARKIGIKVETACTSASYYVTNGKHLNMYWGGDGGSDFESGCIYTEGGNGGVKYLATLEEALKAMEELATDYSRIRAAAFRLGVSPVVATAETVHYETAGAQLSVYFDEEGRLADGALREFADMDAPVNLNDVNEVLAALEGLAA
ncbi:hypothetical protein [Microbispora sp. NPDC049125]|uniref:hypothetical protein n=1 Tax=Microbispora sp. NPDC049125 TaxID=3154929 RepID=UPI0034656BC5